MVSEPEAGSGVPKGAQAGSTLGGTGLGGLPAFVTGTGVGEGGDATAPGAEYTELVAPRRTAQQRPMSQAYLENRCSTPMMLPPF
jgi:hypothetical protein